MAPKKTSNKSAKKGPKKAAKDSNTSQPSSSKQKKGEAWRAEAEARVRRNKQYGMKDIRVFEIDISASKEEWDALNEDRENHLRRVAATFVQGAPVTCPRLEGFITYHIVRLTDKKGGRPSVDLLFQEYDLYFIAFQIRNEETSDATSHEDPEPSAATIHEDPEPSGATIHEDPEPSGATSLEDHEPSDAASHEDADPSDNASNKEPPPSDARGWFAYLDAVMPDFMEYLRVNYILSYGITSKKILLGFGVPEEILDVLLGFNTDNYLYKSAERDMVLHSTPYMMSELLRLGHALEEVGDMIMREIKGPLTEPLVNNWGNISRVALRYEHCQKESILKNAASNYKLQLCSDGSSTYLLSKLVGPDGYLRVLLYSEEYVADLLKKRQKDSPPTRVLVLKILTRRGQSFNISEVGSQLHEECKRQGKVTGFLVDETEKILVQFSHPREASEAKLLLDGYVVGRNTVDARFSSEESFSLLRTSISCKLKQAEVQQQSSEQTPPPDQDFAGTAADRAIVLPESSNQIESSYKYVADAAAKEEIFQGPSSNAESSDKQNPVSDNFTNTSVGNVRSDKQSLEQESEKPALLEELHLLACVARSVPSTPTERITISSTLLRRLGKILPPPQLEYYSSRHGELRDLLASNKKLFVVQGDLIHLLQGAQQKISAQIAHAKFKVAVLPSETQDLPNIAVTPRANRG